MWYWYELLFIGITSDLILNIFFKKYIDRISYKLKKYLNQKIGYNQHGK